MKSVHNQILNRVRYQVYDRLDHQLKIQTRNRAWKQVSGPVRDQVYTQVLIQVLNQVDD